MPLYIKNEIKLIQGKEKLEEEVTLQVTRYMEAIFKCKDMDLAFLKSFGYLEELIDKILLQVGMEKSDLDKIGTSQKMKICTTYIKYDELEDSFKKAKKMITLRNNIAHKLDYWLSDDIDFLKKLNLTENSSLHEKIKSLANIFSDIYQPLLFIVLGADHSTGVFEWKNKK